MRSASVPRIDIPSATDDPAAYVEALLETAGSLDVFDILPRTPVRARELCARLPLDLASQEPEPGEWPPSVIVSHLFDVDIVYGFRWRLALTEDNPSYPGYDEERFTSLGVHLPIWQLLDAWSGLRAANVALLRSLPATAWERTGRHGEQGGETVALMTRKVVGHDIAHLNQIYRSARSVLSGAGRDTSELDAVYRSFA